MGKRKQKQGTKTRTQQSIELDVENLGGTLNAYTTREQTAYFTKVFKGDQKFAIELLGDIVQNATLDQKNIERERYTILREKEEIERNKTEAISDYLHSIAFQTSPLGRTILGTEENIKTISRESLENYVKKHYTADRIVVAAAGAVDHQQVVEEVSKNFQNIASAQGRVVLARPADHFTGSLVTVSDTTSDDVHISIGYKGASWDNPDFLTLLLIQNIIGHFDASSGLGQNSSSRLAELVATEHLAESFNTTFISYLNTGITGVNLKTNYHHTEDLVCEVLSEYVRIGHSVSEGEVQRAKKRLLAASLAYLEGNGNTADHIGRQVLNLGRYISPAELFLRIQDITVADVRSVARQYFTDTEVAVAAIGNCHLFPDYNLIRGWTFWNRL